MIRRNTLNNLMLRNIRRTKEYQTVITDLTILGIIDIKDAEMLLGYRIPGTLKTPDGRDLKHVVDTVEDEVGTVEDEVDTVEDEVDTVEDEVDTVEDEVDTVEDVEDDVDTVEE